MSLCSVTWSYIIIIIIIIIIIVQIDVCCLTQRLIILHDTTRHVSRCGGELSVSAGCSEYADSRWRRRGSTVSRRCTCECRCRRRRCRSKASVSSTTAASLSSSRSQASSSSCRRRLRPSFRPARWRRPCPTSTSRSVALAVTCPCRSASCRSWARSRDSVDRTTTSTFPCCRFASSHPTARYLAYRGYRHSPHLLPSNVSS